ncbi:MFS-type transporter clz9-like [Neodiprion fabricii]|uniref:MFS-type transporter clz9-like n=1 Tax=Neodiprion fabricii TaxID=2872261 RepID=UPI001ED90DA1|nr:MFS-type transporter clz9-like [Neodiprion fabricii]
MAGKGFFSNFKKRNPDSALRTPEPTSLSRATGFYKAQVNRFYDLLLKLQEQFSFQASQVYNADETGVTTVHKNDKVLSVKGKKQVGKLTSAERSRNITTVFAMNAVGHFVPPMFIFPRAKMEKNGRLMVGAPPESIGVAAKSGWMNGELFLQWLQHFQRHVHSSEAHPILLILGGHSSHKELSVIEYARDHHIHMLRTAQHTTHRLQLLDCAFFKPFKQAYGSAGATWMRRNPEA